jgi:four helix bundle protein
VIEPETASSRKDYTDFFTCALKSTNEWRFWLGLLRALGRGGKDTVNKLLREATEIANILADSILTLKEGKMKDFCILTWQFDFLSLIKYS